jgi:hypothetical protein
LNRQQRITRRQLLLSAAALGLTLLCPPLRSWSILAPSHDSLRTRLIRLLLNQDSARIIGQAYVRVAPTEATPDVLFNLLLNALPAERRGLSTASDHELRRVLLLSERQDFQEGRIVSLDGWIASLTEARLCALAALRRPTDV